MGFSLKKVTKSLGPVSAVSRLFDPLNITGADQSGIVDGLMGGLKENTNKYNADALAGDINALGASGIRDFIAPAAKAMNDKYYKDPSSFVQNQIGNENKLLTSAADDAARRTRQLVAQRGMQGSSAGLAAENASYKSLRDKLAMNNASAESRIKDLYGEKMQLGSNLLGFKTAQGPIQMTDISQKTGGLKGLMQDYIIPLSEPAAKVAAAKYGKGA
jgi:hypothetical protein